MQCVPGTFKTAESVGHLWRVMIPPKMRPSRRKKYQVKAGSSQKNRPLGAEMDFDFGEADFFDFSGLGKGREVEMGGV